MMGDAALSKGCVVGWVMLHCLKVVFMMIDTALSKSCIA